MNKLSRVLENLSATLKEHPVPKNTYPMQPLGLTKSAGLLTTMDYQPPQQNQNGKPQEIQSEKKSKPSMPLRSRQGEIWLAKALEQTCQLQRAYGKTDAELETLVDGFVWILGDEELSDVQAAMAAYVRNNNQIPTPSEILEIIQPPVCKFDTATYLLIKKRQQEGQYVGFYEREYLAMYEESKIAEGHDGQEKLRRVKADMEMFKSKEFCATGNDERNL